MSHLNQYFDVAILGGGPGGYPAAIRAAQLGQSVVLIEAKELGGTCLNRGCIPSKTLIANAETLQKIRNAEEYGITVGSLSFDYRKMVERKDQIVSKVRHSLESLIASNKITLLRGFGKLTSPKTIKVTGPDQALIQAGKIILATGSEPRPIAAFPFDHEKIYDSTSLLEMKQLPASIIIVGGGIIGCEFASLFAILGVKVTIIESMAHIVPMEGANISKALTKAFTKKGIKIETGAQVEAIDKLADGVCVRLASGQTLSAERALVAIGRKLNTSGIGLELAGVSVDEKGIVSTNSKMETNVPGIYAVGDIASKWWLAHVASHQGLVAASNAAGHTAHMNYNAIPNVIFTDPEIGTVGLTLEEATLQGYDATLGAFPFQALGKSQAIHETEGFAQVVIDRKTKQILGAQVVGYEASALISEMAIAVANELTVESITETLHAHPTLPEAWLEAALLANETPLHFPPKKLLKSKEYQ